MGAGAFDGAQEAARYIAELTKELRELSTLPLGQLGDQLKEILAGAKAAVKGIQEVKKAAEDLKPGQWVSGPGAKAGGVTLSGGFSATGGYQWPVWGELLTPEQKIAAGAGVTPNADSSATAAAFKALADRIDKFQGDTNNYWSQLLNKEIPYLTKGATSAASAEGLISSILKWAIPGIMQELANPKTPIEMRKILEQLMQFAQSGHLQIDKLARASERIEQKVTAVGEHVAAGIGGERALNQQLERSILALGGSTR